MFSKWILESKGIKIDNNTSDTIYELSNKIILLSNKIKENEIILVGNIDFYNKYKNENTSIKLYAVHKENEYFYGRFINNEIQINLAQIQNITSQKIGRIIIHELIHFIDPKTYDNVRKSNKKYIDYDKNNKLSYFKQPIEFEAYVGIITNTITRIARRTKRKQQMINIFNQSLEYIKNPNENKIGIFQDPEIGHFFDLYYKNSGKNQKRILLTRIYNALIDGLKILNK